jgi:hypothetical protein
VTGFAVNYRRLAGSIENFEWLHWWYYLGCGNNDLAVGDLKKSRKFVCGYMSFPLVPLAYKGKRRKLFFVVRYSVVMRRSLHE